MFNLSRGTLRRAIASVLAALSLAACGGQVAEPGLSPSPLAGSPFDVAMVGPINSTDPQCQSQGCLLAGSPQRLSLIVADTSDSSHNAVADATVAVQVLDINPGAGAKPLGPEQSAVYHGAGLQEEGLNRGVYVTTVSFTRPGNYLIVSRVSRGVKAATVRTPLAVAATDPGIPVGAPAPRLKNLLATDVKDISTIDTAVHPDDMHYITLADSIASHHASVVYLGTPGFCQSKTCAPEVGAVKALEPAYKGRGVDFIHIETYKGGRPDAKQTLNPDFAAFKVLSEPWVFILDRDGNIAAKFSGAAATDEIQAALDRVLA
ncbi:MAG: TlpA family protein disulfide reductase [Candidatus Dormibacteria bacterium]